MWYGNWITLALNFTIAERDEKLFFGQSKNAKSTYNRYQYTECTLIYSNQLQTSLNDMWEELEKKNEKQ